jgi:hypothetical protein
MNRIYSTGYERTLMFWSLNFIPLVVLALGVHVFLIYSDFTKQAETVMVPPNFRSNIWTASG